MPAFAFRLQRVLDVRRLEEDASREAFRLARAARGEAEEEITTLRHRRAGLLAHAASTLGTRMDMETWHGALDRDEASAQNRLALLSDDEERAAEEYGACRAAAEALSRLREADQEEWRRDEARREQAELDEWAVMRR